MRGAVASYLGRDYTGIDLSANQVETNRTRIEEIGGLSGNIEYLVGDSRKVLTTLPTRAGVISREKAIEIITPYLAVTNQYAVDLAKKYGQRPRKIGMLSYLR